MHDKLQMTRLENQLLGRALDIAGKVYGPEHADVATYLNNLARVLKAQVRGVENERWHLASASM